MESASVTDNPSPPASADDTAAESAADLREVKPVPTSDGTGDARGSSRKRGGKSREKTAKPAAPIDVPEGLAAKVEAVLLSASRAVAAGKIAQAVGLAHASADDADEDSTE